MWINILLNKERHDFAWKFKNGKKTLDNIALTAAQLKNTTDISIIYWDHKKWHKNYELLEQIFYKI